MTNNQRMFLYTVEEMSFTRAAKRAYISQQCLSAHIGSLEKEYGVKLFDRRPHLALTAAGRIVYDSLLRIKELEETMCRQISADTSELSGELQIGFPTARAGIFLPDLLQDFYKKYPRVKVCITLDSSENLAEQAVNGKLDLVLSVHTAPRQELSRTLIAEEPIYLVIGAGLLSGRLPFHSAADLILPADFLQGIPLISTPRSSTLKQMIVQFLTREQVIPEEVLSVDDYQTAISLCRANVAAFFCPESILLHPAFNGFTKEGMQKEMMVFRVDGLSDTLRIESVIRKNRYLPPYALAFADLLISQYREKKRRLMRLSF